MATTRAELAAAAYWRLVDLAAERHRTGGWSLADVYEFSSAIQGRFLREYGRPLSW
jgi:hypothetical protein